MSWKQPLILLSFFAALTFLFLESRDLDRTSRLEILEEIQKLKLHDAELDRDVVMAKSGMLSNYDPLMLDRQQLRKDLKDIKTVSANASASANDAIRAHLDQLDKSLTEKLTQVEHFKSDNALIRNSLMYLTYSVAILEADADLQRVKSSDSAHLQHTLLRFVETLDSNAGKEIETELNRLTKIASGTSVPILVAHGRIIVEVLPQLETMLKGIISSPASADAIRLESALLQYGSRVEARAQQFRYAAFFFSLILLGYLLHQYRQLRSTSIDLAASNAGLQLEMVERAQAEIELRSRVEQSRAITDHANEAIITIDKAGRISDWNAAAVELFGYESEEILGKPLSRLIPAELRTSNEMGVSDWVKTGVLSGPRNTVETRALRQDGRSFLAEMSHASWKTVKGHFETCIIRDNTEKRRLEEIARQQELQLIQTNKMTTLGTIVSGVAHEINNPNQYILMNAGILDACWTDTLKHLDEARANQGEFMIGGLPYSEMRQSVPRLIHDIQEGSKKIEKIVAGLKDYARPQTANMFASFDLNLAAQRSVDLLGHLITKHTTNFNFQPSKLALYTYGNITQIEQVVSNLLVNALESLGDRNKSVTLFTGLDQDKRQVWVSVKDEGVGMNSELLKKICEPFFSTKHEHGGTGLGLAISSALVKAHRGQLDFNSGPGSGTCVVLTLQQHV